MKRKWEKVMVETSNLWKFKIFFSLIMTENSFLRSLLHEGRPSFLLSLLCAFLYSGPETVYTERKRLKWQFKICKNNKDYGALSILHRE